ncbi:MAG TPA: DUF2891 domain-containing protein [Candidatus Limnocylindrales bacterium]|nr:DUF2891 domain-containing protein [Candidatus Limnocylindrales bacterium]
MAAGPSASDTRRSPTSHALTAQIASRFAAIALGHVTREFPSKLDHVLDGPADARTPRQLHPLFYGSFDWHSCVHGYWLLARLHRLYPELPESPAISALLDTQLTTENVAAEIDYLRRPSSRAFERPYGWAWLLMLAAELARERSPQRRRWSSRLSPLADCFTERFLSFLPGARYPIRSGTHANTAFALSLVQEYADVVEDRRLTQAATAAALAWYGGDVGCQAWEPSLEDFLSPALVEAQCMRRAMHVGEFREWFARFLPRAAGCEPATLFTPATVSDRSDPRIVHLDGLNLSRSWCWRWIASAFSDDDPLRACAERAARMHLEASLPHVTGHYMGEHWLASFALLALDAGQSPA